MLYLVTFFDGTCLNFQRTCPSARYRRLGFFSIVSQDQSNLDRYLEISLIFVPGEEEIERYIRESEEGERERERERGGRERSKFLVINASVNFRRNHARQFSIEYIFGNVIIYFSYRRWASRVIDGLIDGVKNKIR